MNVNTKRVVTVAMLALLIPLGGAKSCEGTNGHKSAPVKTAPTANVTLAVKALCDFFGARDVDKLDTTQAESNVRLLAADAGVPNHLEQVATDYYHNVPAGHLNRAGSRQAATANYKRMIDACQDYGWKHS